MSPDEKQSSLRVAIEDGELVIRIGADTLANATRYHHNLQHYDEWLEEEFGPEVTDEQIFLGEVVRQLNSEDESGVTPVYEMLDRAVEQAIEYGAEGIETAEERRDRARALRDFPPEVDHAQD